MKENNIEDDVKYVKELLEIARVFFKAVKAETDYKNVDEIAFCNALENILAEREQMLKAINTVEKEKGDWIKAYQEEKDSQFDLLKRIQELEEELEKANRQIDLDYVDENYILKQVVKEGLEDIEDYFDRLNGPDEDIEYIKQIKQELLGGEKNNENIKS